MKFRITMKDPDRPYDCISDATTESLSEMEGLSGPEREALYETRRDKLSSFVDQWLEYGEYITVEFDTEANTAIIVKRGEAQGSFEGVAMKINKELLAKLTYRRPGDEYEGFEVVANQRQGNSRWHEQRLLVLKSEGRLLGFEYEDGLTEYQEGTCWDDEPDELELFQVEPFEFTETRYRELR